jgi:hypothetical protein
MTPIFIAFVLAATLAASPAAAVPGENLLAQWTFDEGINGWDSIDGALWEQVDDCRPLNEQPNPGSLELIADDGVSQCVGVIGDYGYDISVFIKTIITGEVSPQTGISVAWHSDSDCKNYMEGPIIHPFGYYLGATDWYKIQLAGGAPLNAHSALVTLGTVKNGGTGELRARFDDVIFRVLNSPTTTTTTEPNSTTTTTDTVTSTTDEIGAPGCADPVLPYDEITVADALYVLRRSVGLVPCQTCQCDTDYSGTTTTGDALRTLRIAVGQQVSKRCGGCEI